MANVNTALLKAIRDMQELRNRAKIENTAKDPHAIMNHENGLETARSIFNTWKDIDITDKHVIIGYDNGKMGKVASVSLPPMFTCPNGKWCKGYCYAIRSFNKMGYNNNPWVVNYAILKKDPIRFFLEIAIACSNDVPFFRWHVSGDIQNIEYLQGMETVAETCENTQFLAFTKSVEIVNSFMNENGGRNAINYNLHVIFSNAPGFKFENPYNLPECHIAFADSTLDTFRGCSGNVYHCTGNCEQCIRHGVGCFFLKDGDSTIINQH